MVSTLIALLVLLLGVSAAVYYGWAWHCRQVPIYTDPVIAAIPPDDEEVWLRGQRIPYSRARQIALDEGAQVTVSTSVAGPVGQPERRVARIAPLGGDTENTVLRP